MEKTTSSKKGLNGVLRYSGFEYIKSEEENTYFLKCKSDNNIFNCKYWVFYSDKGEESCFSIEHDFDINPKEQKRFKRLIEHLPKFCKDLIVSVEDTREVLPSETEINECFIDDENY